jgi:hypothetical protein
MTIKIVKDKISKEELKEISKEFFPGMIKAVVDVEKEIMALGGELHIDANQKLIERGSEQENIWGINIYLEKPKENWIEFFSLINIKPKAKNFSQEIESPEIKEKIKKIVNKLII